MTISTAISTTPRRGGTAVLVRSRSIGASQLHARAGARAGRSPVCLSGAVGLLGLAVGRRNGDNVAIAPHAFGPLRRRRGGDLQYDGDGQRRTHWRHVVRADRG